MDYTSSDITQITGGSLTGSGDLIVADLLIDSRQVSYTENTAFIAIRGANHDGHDFVDYFAVKSRLVVMRVRIS